VNDVPKNITRKVKVTDKQGDPHWEEVA